MEAIIQPTDLRPEQFVGLSAALCTITALTIGIRIYSNLNHSRKLHADDYLSVVALVFLIWNAVTFSFLMYMFDADPQTITIEYMTRLVSVGIASGNCAVYSAKLPLLFLFIRTFGVQTWLRRTCQVLVVVGILGGLATLLYAGISCSPDLPQHVVAPPFLFSCVTALTDATIARGSLSLAMDVIMFVLPIPVITRLNMPLRRKIGLVFVFMTGLLAIAASALGLYFQKAQTGGTSSNFANALLVTVIESAIVILVSCSPAVHLFWTKHSSPFLSRIGISRLSTRHSTGASKSRLATASGLSSKQSRANTSSGSEVGGGGIQITTQTHHYVELQDNPVSSKGGRQQYPPPYPQYEARAQYEARGSATGGQHQHSQV